MNNTYTINNITYNLANPHTLFFNMMPIIKELQQEDPQGNQNIINEYRLALWHSQIKYVHSLITRYYSSELSPYDRQDYVSSCALVFLEALDKYDPSISAPTTFFSPYYKYKLLHNTSKSLGSISNYYYKHLKLIERTIEHYKSINITHTTEQLAADTNLSIRQINNALLRKVYITDLDTYDNKDFYSKSLEEIVLSNEAFYLLGKYIVATLSVLETEILLMRAFNTHGTNSFNYIKDQINEHFNLSYSITKIRNLYYISLDKLEANEELVAYLLS